MGVIGNQFVSPSRLCRHRGRTGSTARSDNGNVNNYLSGITVAGQSVSPAFDRAKTTGYTVNLPATATVPNIQVTTESPYAAVSISGNQCAAGW